MAGRAPLFRVPDLARSGVAAVHMSVQDGVSKMLRDTRNVEATVQPEILEVPGRR
jgi:hypothetical protein